jgi:molybdate transport system substrate-binding protein
LSFPEVLVPNALRATVAGLLLLLSSAAAQAATIKVLCDGPLEPVLPAIGEAFRGKTGHRIDFVFAPSPIIRKKIADGETADLVMIQPDFLAELAANGKVDAGDHPAFGRVGIGLAARADAPAREIKTADMLKQVLQRADTIVFNTVASGNYFAKVLERLGIADDVKGKVVRTGAADVFEQILKARGDDIAVGTITLILADKRLKLIGALPAELQSYLQYAAIPMIGSPNKKAAVEFIRFLFTPAVKAQLAAAGVE